MLSVQYFVNGLEEDHVCHGITTQEPRPRPMKEILHSRHHSTVLLSFGASRKESLQNLHTHVVESAIHLLGNNRVLKECPPPIADEEQTELAKTMYSLTATIRIRPSTAGLQA